MDEKSEYEKAFMEIDLFDALVMDTLKTQRSITVPFHHLEDKTEPIERRMAETLFKLNAQVAELLEADVNPSIVIRGFMRSLQDAYINPANDREQMGIPQVKKQQAIANIETLVSQAIDNKSLVEDLKAIV